jgi:hypothetical protein
MIIKYLIESLRPNFKKISYYLKYLFINGLSSYLDTTILWTRPLSNDLHLSMTLTLKSRSNYWILLNLCYNKLINCFVIFKMDYLHTWIQIPRGQSFYLKYLEDNHFFFILEYKYLEDNHFIFILEYKYLEDNHFFFILEYKYLEDNHFIFILEYKYLEDNHFFCILEYKYLEDNHFIFILEYKYLEDNHFIFILEYKYLEDNHFIFILEYKYLEANHVFQKIQLLLHLILNHERPQHWKSNYCHFTVLFL